MRNCASYDSDIIVCSLDQCVLCVFSLYLLSAVKSKTVFFPVCFVCSVVPGICYLVLHHTDSSLGWMGGSRQPLDSITEQACVVREGHSLFMPVIIEE